MNNAFFSDLLASISERGRTLLRRAGSSNGKQDASDLIELCEALLSGRGEASGTAMAREVLDRYRHLDDKGRLSFFEALVRNYGPDREKLAQAIETWRAQPSDDDASELHFASEPRRQELIRRLNRAPGGTSELVAMRADLLLLMNGHKELAALDRDVVHLLASWFNRGFLVLRRIDWSTPANILEKIIRYEAVHEIRDWDDLRRRIDPVDRRCYAFFHPALVDEPLIFVEVALTESIPAAIEAQAIPVLKWTVPKMKLGAFHDLAADILDRAQKNNWKMAVAIVDTGGYLVYFERMQDTQTGSVDLAIEKARTAALFRRPTKLFQDSVAAGGEGLRLVARFFLLAFTVGLVEHGVDQRPQIALSLAQGRQVQQRDC